MNQLSVAKAVITCLVLTILSAGSLYALDDNEKSILIITSYNPEMRSMQSNLDAFTDVYNSSDIKPNVSIESMDCAYPEDAYTWKARMKGIMERYSGNNTPDIVLLLGQEAWSAYLSQDSPRLKNIPIMGAMISRNTVELPDSQLKVSTWNPEAKDIRTDFPDFNIVGGYAYEYNIKSNIGLLKQLFPDVKNVVFLTDNTFGGINMQAWIRSQMAKYPEYSVEFLDGRQLNSDQVADRIKSLPDSTVLFCGTWRIDSSGKFVLGNAMNRLGVDNPELPVLTISSAGLGTWAIGGFIPQYRVLGAELAHDCLAFLKDSIHPMPVTIVPGQYSFDYKHMKPFGITIDKIPETAKVINRPSLINEQHKLAFIIGGIILLLLLIALSVALFYIRKIRRLTRQMENRYNSEAQKTADFKRKYLDEKELCERTCREIRSPLNVVLGYSQILAGSVDDKIRPYADRIARNCNKVLRTFDDVEIYSALNDDNMTDRFPPEKTSLNDVCAEAYNDVEFRRSPTTDYRYLPLPESDIVHVNRTLLKSAVSGILYNAFKFTESGTVTLQCELSVDCKEILIIVDDEGKGIPSERQESVFEKYDKIDHSIYGIGIGLTLCEMIAVKLGGSIIIESIKDSGTRIVLSIPR